MGHEAEHPPHSWNAFALDVALRDSAHRIAMHDVARSRVDELKVEGQQVVERGDLGDQQQIGAHRTRQAQVILTCDPGQRPGGAKIGETGLHLLL